MSCGYQLAKVIFALLNFVFVVIGIAMLTTGVWAIVDSSSLMDAISQIAKQQISEYPLYKATQIIEITAYILVGLGLALFVIAFCGCWGTVVENRYLLICYSSVLCLLIVIKLICVILLFSLQPHWKPKLINTLKNQFAKSYRGSIGAFTSKEYDFYSYLMDTVMISLQCCGFNGTDDFENYNLTTRWYNEGRNYTTKDGVIHTGDKVKIPVACCQFTNIKFMTKGQSNVYKNYLINDACPLDPIADYKVKPCLTTIKTKIKSYTTGLILATVIILVLEVGTLPLSIYLAIQIRRFANANFY